LISRRTPRGDCVPSFVLACVSATPVLFNRALTHGNADANRIASGKTKNIVMRIIGKIVHGRRKLDDQSSNGIALTQNGNTAQINQTCDTTIGSIYILQTEPMGGLWFAKGAHTG